VSLRVEAKGEALVLTIDRPKTRNAIDRDLATRLGEVVRAAETNPKVRAIVLTATGEQTFVSGGDLHEINRAVEEQRGPGPVLDLYHDMLALETTELPVIAAVQGDVYGGGCELLLLCDMVLVESHASLAFRHAKMGLSPAWGGITRLFERVGPMVASRLLFAAEKIGAEEARRLGLVNEVVPTGQAESLALALSGRIADHARSVVGAQKRALLEVRRAMRGDSIERERAIFGELFGGQAHRAALDAFFRKNT